MLIHAAARRGSKLTGRGAAHLVCINLKGLATRVVDDEHFTPLSPRKTCAVDAMPGVSAPGKPRKLPLEISSRLTRAASSTPDVA